MKKILVLIITLSALSLGCYLGYPFYRAFTVSKTSTNINKVSVKKIEIPKGTEFNQLGEILVKQGVLNNADDFNFLVDFKEKNRPIELAYIKVEPAKWKNYNDVLNNVITQLKGGAEIIDIQFNNVTSITEIAELLTKDLDLNTAEFVEFLNSQSTMQSLGFDDKTYSTFFIPVKLEVYKDISKEELLGKLKDYYKTFWNEDRMQKANSLGLSQSQVTILASIVYEEQKVKFDEQPKIAGLYLNRLNQGWLLQADPTVKFALGDPTIKRLLFKHLEVQSPYNTYIHKGLPPGPISFPESQTIDAVLNYEKHDYMYMCAKPEYSGYHNFSKTLNQHNIYATEYQKWLSSEGIK